MKFSCAALVLLAASVAGLAHDADAPELRHDAWQSDNGLPHDVVRALAQTPDGYLWIGMTNAIARFDGVRIVRVAGEQLLSTQLTGIASDRKGRLVVATLSGVFRLEGERLIPLAVPPRVHSVRTVAVDSLGYIWMGGEQGLFRIDESGNNLTAFLPHLYVQSLLADRDGSVWAGTRTGLFRLSPQGQTSDRQFPGVSVTAVVRVNDAVLAGTDGQGLYAIRADARPQRIYERDLGSHIMALHRDRSGDLWVGTWERGLFRVSNSKVSQPVDSLRDGVQLMTLFEDAQGGMWAGTRGSGLHRILRQAIRNWSSQDGMPHRLAWTATQTPDSTIWIGTDGGLASIRDGKVRTYGAAAGFRGRVITTVAAAPDGSVFAGTPRNGIVRMRNGREEAFPLPDVEGTTLNYIYFTRNGHMWVCTMKGILELDGARVVRRITSSEGLPANGVRSLTETPDGAVWASTAKGAVRLSGSRISVYAEPQGFVVPSIRAITHDRSGNVWATTQGGGLCKFTNERFSCIGRDRGLPDNDILAAIPDSQGYLWLTTTVGIHRVSIAELDSVLSGEHNQIRLYSLGQQDGMGTDTCTAGIQPGALLASDGRLWVPTLKGVATLDVRQPLIAPPLNPIVERVTAGGEFERDLQVEFTAPLLSGGRRVHFRYRLAPFDRDWISVDDRRTAYYTNLPPGRFEFRLAVRNQDGDWVETSAPPVFEVRPRFFETAWFKLLVVAVLAGLVLWFVQWRLDAATRRRRELTRMVEERTRELELARTRLERADQAKSNFLSFISHEIRTPLNGILAMTTLWHTFRREDEHRQALETIESCGEALLGIVNNVLDLTRIEAGRLDLEESVVSPRSLVERALSVVTIQAAKKGVDVRCSVSDSMPATVRADGTRLRQVLLNLLGNAVKFTHKGSIEVTASAEPESEGHWRLRFSVRDTGVGIRPELLPSLFEPFSHASTNTARSYGGSGLGLSISQRIVHAMNGDIHVSSEVGKGSVFEFDVLVAEATAHAAAEEQKPVLVDPSDSPEVLVVEDNRVNQIVAAKMLTTLGCRVEIAESGAEALRILADPSHDFRIVFMDCMMPELDGFETTRRIRSMPSVADVPVVAISADAFSWSRDKALEAGMNSYLTKPLRIDEVRRELAFWAAPGKS